MKNYKLYEFDEYRIYKYCKKIGMKSKLCSAAIVGGSLNYMHV